MVRESRGSPMRIVGDAPNVYDESDTDIAWTERAYLRSGNRIDQIHHTTF